ncbi:MAG: RNA polymerase sigma-70 factor [Bacteroidetes bacterium]|nr:RNA polymerase sigma-70 factor [Bacteroidota bacterium]
MIKGIDEKKMIDQLANGNELALKKIIDFFSPKLYVFCLGFVKKHEIAEEIVSDIFVKIWERREKLVEIKNLKSYLYILTRNESISYLRSIKNKQFISIELLDDFFLEGFQSADTEIINTESLHKINTVIQNLPPRSKMAFTLAKINGLKYKEIAEIMDISVRTVDNHIAQSLNKICLSFGIDNKPSTQKINRILSMLILFT